jgi:WD40 repeat protein
MAENLEYYYKILGLQPGASQQEIKRAYRRLVKIWHPDRFAQSPQQRQQAEATLKQLNIAYQVLKSYRPPPPRARPASTAVKPSSSLFSRADSFYQQGTIAARRGDYEQAIERFSWAIRLNPKHTAAYRYRGHILSLLGYERRAFADLQRAAALELNRSPATSFRARSTSPRKTSKARSWRGWRLLGAWIRQGLTWLCRFLPQRRQPRRRSPTAKASKTLSCDQILSGHSGPVTCLSQSGALLASGSLDQTIRLWNLQTHQSSQQLPSKQLLGHRAPVLSVSLSPDRQLLASGSEDHTVMVWDLYSGDRLYTLIDHTAPVESVVITGDSQMLVSGSWDHTLKIWRLRNGRLLHTLIGHSGPVNAVAVGKNGQIVVSGSDDGTVKLWNMATGQLIKTLVTGSSPIRCLAIHLEAGVIAIANRDWEIQVWDWRDQRPLHLFMGHANHIRAMALNAEGQILTSGSDDGTVKLWHLKQRRLLDTLVCPGTAITSLIDNFKPNALTSGHQDGSIRVWRQAKDASNPLL